MHVFFKYIVKQHPEVKIIKLTDEATTNCKDISIDLYKLYMLKYGIGFYEKQFGFQLEENDNMIHVLNIHKLNKINLKNIIIDKKSIVDALNKMLYRKYSNNNIKLISEFMNNINDGELVSIFLIRYKAPENFCEIFDTFINIMFNMHLQILPQQLVYYIMIDDVKHNRTIFPIHKHIQTIKHLPKFTNRKTKKSIAISLSLKR